MNTTSSADPAQLEAAAQAVGADVMAQLDTAADDLADLLTRFSRGYQMPELVKVDTVHHMGMLRWAIEEGKAIDTELVRVAAAFRTAGRRRERPPGFIGPFMPSRVLTLDDGQLSSAVAAWKGPVTADLGFRKGADGRYEVRAPDGNWYVMVDTPPSGAPRLAQVEKTVDFENPDFGMVLSAFILIGLTGGQTQPMDRAAPRRAYDYIHLDDQGYPVAGPEIVGLSQPTRPPVLGDASVSKIEAIGLVQGGLAEASKGMSAANASIVHTQTTFYVDPATNRRVAVVDAAQIRYDNDTNDAIVMSGRLHVDDRGRPSIAPRPASGTGPVFTPPTTLRIPAKDR